MTAIATPTAAVIDCADPTALAEFYRRVTGWAIVHEDADSAYLSDGGALQLGFQRLEGYRAPDWPDSSAHTHLEFAVADVDLALDELREIGASVPRFQPGAGEWTVVADPEGHVFCVAAA
jgi:predicted enzyme related to lactoylglutathione lyase